jgi:hypothetical protein
MTMQVKYVKVGRDTILGKLVYDAARERLSAGTPSRAPMGWRLFTVRCNLRRYIAVMEALPLLLVALRSGKGGRRAGDRRDQTKGVLATPADTRGAGGTGQGMRGARDMRMIG